MKPDRRVALVIVSLMALLAPAQPAAAALPLTLVAGGFDQPVYVTHAGDARLFVVEQTGRIKVIDGGTTRVFLNLSNLITTAGGEQGLLGLAFHPSYAANGRFYVNYTRSSDGDTIIAEYRRSADNPNRADKASRRVLMRIDQPASNHNGGWMGFRGKLLYIATGDGGGAPGDRPQNLSTLLGKVLRINPLDPDGGGPKRYGVPATNPYVGRAGRDEIWSLGLRNPWRCSFDRDTGRMWCADVGQNEWEEVNRVGRGKAINYGWPIMEGRECYNASSCDTSGLRMPVAVYSHSGYGGGNCSVTGGYVSRRSGAALFGKYVFGDYCSGRVWAIPAGFTGNLSQANHLLRDTPYFISSFGEGFNGRLYLVDRGGRVFQLNDS